MDCDGTIPPVPPPDASPTLRRALEIAREAAELVMHILPEPAAAKGVRLKGPTDLVTRADCEAEALIARRLREAFPDHLVLGEEAAGHDDAARARRGPAASPRWLIDPIDGTANFAHGVPWFAISLGLEVAGQVQCGVVALPPLYEFYVAERGRGAYLLQRDRAPLRLAVSQIAQLERALVATGLPGEPARSRHVDAIPRVMRRAQELRIMGAAAIHLALVAAGRLEAFWEPHLHPWDVAAGVLLVEEAGGRVTDLRGRALRGPGGDVLASNGLVHDAVLAVLRPRPR